MKRFISFLVIGGVGGILLNNFVFPSFLKPQIQTVIKEIERVVVAEPDFWKNVVSKSERSVALVQYFSSPGVLVSQSSGIILTNDGLIAVPLNFIPRTLSSIQIFADSKIFSGKLAITDAANNLALVKIEASGLPILDFVPAEDISLGQSLLVLGKKIKINQVNSFVQLSLVKEFDRTTLLDTESGQISGSALLSANGKLAGMVQVSGQGQVFAVPPAILKNLLDKYLSQPKEI